MMIALSNYNNLTPEEYLQFEEKSPIKHEYIDGQVYAMAGTTDTHNIIGLNFTFIIRNHLRGSNCRVYFADLKVRLEKRNHFYYPDIIVTCDDRDKETATYKSFPKLIIEVLSDSTEAFDRGDKFNDYQTLDSLEEYVLVNSKHQRVETFRRGEQGLWILQTYQEESFSLQSINLTASFSDLYEDVTLETVNYPLEGME
jgi:Uma2 family endonuclease